MTNMKQNTGSMMGNEKAREWNIYLFRCNPIHDELQYLYDTMYVKMNTTTMLIFTE